LKIKLKVAILTQLSDQGRIAGGAEQPHSRIHLKKRAEALWTVQTLGKGITSWVMVASGPKVTF
jgi:hypothetical protein